MIADGRVSRQGLSDAFAADEARKSNLIVEARLLREQRDDQAAAHKFAEAAEIESRLGEQCIEQGLLEKAVVHRFSAASCWAQAGNFFEAINRCNSILADSNLKPTLRSRVAEYRDVLLQRRAEWYEEVIAGAGA